ncbi:uncharacterized protein A1O9_11474 [Exophiala aquamarina CBS 119918]|uniref:Transcription factor domain-containing protein n=1 Tax=Exophiala aquamarina CBS 119918 TaxID=1182545 RepID=A0A072NYG9_9EURO|nr:uncharacterized protein A1O9_11474 [Exophiala aquamarina CBS 119918]KEF52631.1 hypothetical protein A1O9_11474 [Exophiala aquamarina CBS 119918]
MADPEEQGPNSSDPPPSSPRPPTYTGPFLFVNKNATNLRSRQRDEVFAVRSHAMQIARRSRKPSKVEAGKSLNEKAAENVDLVQNKEGEGPDQGQSTAATEQRAIGQAQPALGSPIPRSQRPATGKSHPTGSRRNSGRLHVARTSSASGRSQPQAAAAQLTATTPLPAQILASIMHHAMGFGPSAPLGNISPGPFSAAALPISSFFNSLLQFWRLGYMSNFWPATIAWDPAHDVPQLVDDWIRTSVSSSPAMLHGLFAGTLSFITNYLPTSAATPVLWARGMHHHGKCLEYTRSRLAMPGVSGEEALGMIHQSTTFSFHCGDFDASSVHRVASARILNTLEHGLESVHPVLKSLLILCDTLISTHKPKRPSLDIEFWAPGSWHDEEALRPFDESFDFDPSDYAQSDRELLVFTEPVYGPELEDPTVQLQGLVNLQREALCACDLAAQLTEGDGVAIADPIYSWLALRQYALTCRCAGLYMDMVESEQEPHTIPVEVHLRRVLPSCILLATSYTFQLILRCSMQSPCISYIPFHHLRNRLTLMMTLMGEARRMQSEDMMHVPTETLLFLFFAGAVAEEINEQLLRSPPANPEPYGRVPSASAPASLLHIRWFSVHFSMVLQRLGLADWEAVQDILERFVYDRRTMDKHVQVLFGKRSEFLGVLSGGSAVDAHRSTNQVESPSGGAMLGGSFLGQQDPGASSDSQVFPPVSDPDYEGSMVAMHPGSALSPITGQDFAAGFWEHMGLGMDLEVDRMGAEQDEEAEEVL